MQNKNKKTILVIDDEAGIRFSIRGILEDEGYAVLEAESGELGLKVLEDNLIDLVFLDIWLPGIDGPQVLEKVRELYPDIPVLMISGHATIENAVHAIRNGAHDFIEKPLSLEKILISVSRSLEFKNLKHENAALRSNLPELQAENLLGESKVIQELRKLIAMVAPQNTGVLITGENGAGKEVVAKQVHAFSTRAKRPMIAINCAAIPEELIESELFGHEKGAFTGADSSKVGKFELANNGTLFLDEIGDMSLKTQAKILRILQEKCFERVGGTRSIHVDVRIIAATNKDLKEAIKNNQFRADLYYRLKVFPLHLPPLRERERDVLILLDFFVGMFQKKSGLHPISFTADAEEVIVAYPWPGNIRELRNFTERMMIMYGNAAVDVSMLPSEFAKYAPAQAKAKQEKHVSSDTLERLLSTADLRAARAEFEALYLDHKLVEYYGNISKMAQGINIERSYLHRKLKHLDIER